MVRGPLSRRFGAGPTTFDRSPTSHAVNLFDIDSKYADVITVDAALDYLAGTRLRQAV